MDPLPEWRCLSGPPKAELEEACLKMGFMVALGHVGWSASPSVEAIFQRKLKEHMGNCDCGETTKPAQSCGILSAGGGRGGNFVGPKTQNPPSLGGGGGGSSHQLVAKGTGLGSLWAPSTLSGHQRCLKGGCSWGMGKSRHSACLPGALPGRRRGINGRYPSTEWVGRNHHSHCIRSVVRLDMLWTNRDEMLCIHLSQMAYISTVKLEGANLKIML